MRSIVGLLTTMTLLAACSHDASRDGGTAMPASLQSTASQKASDPPETPRGPVDPAAAKAAWKDGVSRLENGDFAAAAAQLELAVAGKPDDAYRRYLLGLSQWKSGDRDGAEASLVESAKLDATRLKTWINLARVRHDRGDRKGALEASETALGLDPTSADALHQKGRALMELNRGEEAVETLKSARDLEPGNGYIANTLGLLMIQLGRPVEAIEPLEAAKVTLPHVAYVRNNLGVAYERAGRLNEAKIEYLAAVDAGDAGGKAMKSLVRLGATDTTTTSDAAVTTASAKSE